MVWRSISSLHLAAIELRRQRAGAVAGMDAGLLDVLHDAADDDALAVGRSRRRRPRSRRRGTCRSGADALGRRSSARSHVAAQARPRRRRSPSRGRRARRTAEPAPGSRSARATATRLVDGCARCRFAAACRPELVDSIALKRSRSSARSIASGEVPRIGTPACSSGTASLSGVCPPNCTITPSGFSRSTIAITSSNVSGSKYSRSEVS